MSTKSKKRGYIPSKESMTKAVYHAMVIFLWAFCCEFSPEQEMLDRLSKQLASVRESVMCGSLTIPQIRKALMDDYGVET